MTETEAILNRAVTLDELKLLKLRYMRALQTDTILLADDPEGKLDTPGLYLTDDERTTHMHVMGSSGGGKSKLLEFMIRQDIQRGVGVCVIDPHAELYWNILRYIIEECDDDIKEKVYLINPSQWDYMVSYNPLLMKMGDANSHSLRLIECLDKVFKGEITEKSGIYETLKAVFKLAAIRGFSFHEVKKLLYDKQFRTELVKSFNHSPLGNRELEEFWIKSVNTKVFDDILFWSKSKIDVLSESSPLEMMTLQDESLDLREIIKRNGILLVNLADQAVFNKKSARTLGTMLVSELISNFKDEGGEDFITGKGTKRSPFYMYVDEFHEVYTDDFRIIISGLRKFKLHLVLSNQELGQLTDEMKASVKAVGAKAYFPVRDYHEAKETFIQMGIYEERVKNQVTTYSQLDDGIEETPTRTVSINHEGKQTVSEGIARTQMRKVYETTHTQFYTPEEIIMMEGKKIQLMKPRSFLFHSKRFDECVFLKTDWVFDYPLDIPIVHEFQKRVAEKHPNIYEKKSVLEEKIKELNNPSTDMEKSSPKKILLKNKNVAKDNTDEIEDTEHPF